MTGSLNKEIRMPKLEDWLEKAKTTKLRGWLNLQEIDELISKQTRPTKLYLVSQGHGGFRTLTALVKGIDKRFTALNGTKDELIDLLLDCELLVENEPSRPVKLKARQFLPADHLNELADISRAFQYEIKRDHFVEDIMFLMSISEEDAIAQHTRVANSFFKKFFGPGLGGPPEEQH
jgi:hypothetical protein